MTITENKHMSIVEIVKEFYRAFEKNDNTACLQLCNDSLQWQLAEGMPGGGKDGLFVGKKDVFEGYFPAMLSNFEEFHAVPEKFLEMNGSHVIVTGRYRGTSKARKSIDVEFSHVYLVQDGKIVQFRQFSDTKAIQDAL